MCLVEKIEEAILFVMSEMAKFPKDLEEGKRKRGDFD